MSTTISRSYNFVDDKDNAIPITSARVDAELDAIITKLNQKVLIKSTAPSSPIAGELWLDSTNKLLKQYRNSEWVVMGVVHIGATGSVMSTPQEGDLWYDTTLNTLNVYNGASWDTMNISTADVIGPATNTADKIPQWNGANSKTLKDGLIVTTGATAGAVPIMDGTGYMPDNSVDTSALKTLTYEASSSEAGALVAVTGGSYCFYPQVKVSAGTGAVQIAGDIYDIGTYNLSNTSYATYVELRAAGGGTTYAQFRYVTASGEDIWIFLLLDKDTKKITCASCGHDHPAYGNGDDFDKMPHPFPRYDPGKHEIVMLDKDTCLLLKEESEKTGKSILTLVNEEYKVDSEEKEFKPLHSGRFISKDGKQVKQMVESIPGYITVKGLEKKKK